MRFERGPFGRIAVAEVASETDVVLHALDVLQNHVISSILPVYLREQMGRIQVCIDCTGLLSLSEVRVKNWDSIRQKRECIGRFLMTVVDAQDHFLDPCCFLMEPEYVFWDTEQKMLCWCCIPAIKQILSVSAKKTEEDRTVPIWPDLELLLMDDFFADALDENARNHILCMFKDEREDDLIQYLSEFMKEDENAPTSKKRRHTLAKLLTAQFVLMVLCLTAYVSLQSRIIRIFPGIDLTGWFVLAFTFLLIVSLLFGRNRIKAAVIEKDGKKKESNKFLSDKDMYFPDGKDDSNTPEARSPAPLFSPVFLIQQTANSTKDKKPLRAAVWVDDFLLGRDKSLCDFFLDHSSISDRHARILHRETMYYLVDLASAAGTWIGSRRLYSFEETPLNDGDIITLGDYRFLFCHT